ncbi:hypothetical protein X975_07341, partial [Stegodyphus mimosarum]
MLHLPDSFGDVEVNFPLYNKLSHLSLYSGVLLLATTATISKFTGMVKSVEIEHCTNRAISVMAINEIFDVARPRLVWALTNTR